MHFPQTLWWPVSGYAHCTHVSNSFFTEHIQVRFMKYQEEVVCYLCTCADTDKSVLRLWRGAVLKVPQVLSVFPYAAGVQNRNFQDGCQQVIRDTVISVMF
jgi:hypothetical protein